MGYSCKCFTMSKKQGTLRINLPMDANRRYDLRPGTIVDVELLVLNRSYEKVEVKHGIENVSSGSGGIFTEFESQRPVKGNRVKTE